MTVPAHDLERALAALAEDAFPPTPSLARAVGERLAEDEAPPAPRWRWVPAAALAAAVLAALVLLASPGAREAVADWFGIGGVRIQNDDPGGAPEIGSDLGLGEPVTEAEATDAAGFELRFLGDGYGSPDGLFLATAEGFTQVSAVYRGDEGRLLLTQFRGSPEVPYLKKLVGADDGIEVTDVHGALAFWIDQPHEITYRGPDGTLRTDASRLAEKTLLWERDGITYRLEGDLSKGSAERLAEGLN